MYKLAFTVSIALLGVSACTNTDNPQLAMCQAVTKQLTSNSVSSWDNDSTSDGSKKVSVKVNYTDASGQAGVMTCEYPKRDDGSVDTAPSRVVMNDQPVESGVLIKAGTQASKELLAGTYKNTVEKSAELAGQAAESAADIAEKAKDAALDSAQTLQELQK